MTGKDKFDEARAKLHKDADVKKEADKTEMKEAERTLAVVGKNTELARMYQEASKMGSENLGGQSPLLKVLNIGKSSVSELADGSEPKNGWFFYGPTAEQFKEVEVHILAISRGYKAEPLQPKADGKKQFNQLMAGILLIPDGTVTSGTRTLPFITYVTGNKLQSMWDFGKEAGKYTRAKPIGIPLFALRVKLATHSIPNPNGGLSWIIDFAIMKNEDGSPVVVTDMGEFDFLKNMVEQMQEVMDTIIEKKAIEDDEEPQPIKKIQSTDPAEPIAPGTETVKADEIPF